MEKNKKYVNLNLLGILIYAILALMYILIVIFKYSDVGKNLDGWRGFSKTYALFFAAIGVSLAGAALNIIISLVYNKKNNLSLNTGIVLILMPIAMRLISAMLKGNVKSDISYLVLRTCQGFDTTFIWLLLTALLGCIILIVRKKENTVG